MEIKLKENNLFISIMTKVYQLMILNALFMISALPIVTIGASMTALLSCIKEVFDGSLDHEIKSFMYYFRVSFTKSTIGYLLFVVCSLLVGLNFMVVMQYNWLLGMLQITIWVQLIVTYFCFTYLVVKIETPLLKLMKCSWILGNQFIIQIIGCLGVSYVLLKVFTYSPFLILFFFISICSVLQYVFVFKSLENKINGGTL